ncbi:MAG: portal protein [Polynucleobacter sp.]
MATAPLALVNAWGEPEEQERQPFSETELIAALRREADAANSEYERLVSAQNLAHHYYEAKPFGNEVDGRSQIVLPDVQETIDYMVPSVLRTFVSGDRVVEFEATDEADENAVDEATAAIGYSFMRQQDGYRVLHDWLTCGLIERYGVTKTMAVTEERVTRDRVTISDPVELEGVDAEIEDTEDNDDGTHTVSLKREQRQKRFVDLAVPASEFRFSPLARHEDDADYLAHCPVKTRSELVDMGFDREQVYGLPNFTAPVDGTRWDDPESTQALQQVQLWEEYARIDLDGDGVAERVMVYRVESDILRWADGSLAIETVDEQPFSVFCPFPRPHRLVGWSLADKVMDIQLARSTIARQLFDGMYNANMPRPIVSDVGSNENTIQDILSPVPGSPIRVRDLNAVQPYQTAFDVGKSLTVLEWITGERESRTGITRLNQGLDADALNKTATGTAMMQAQGQQQEEFIARNLAEAFSRLMAKKYRLMRREGEPFRAKVDGQYKQIDPRQWPEDVNVTIRVGLGTGSKDKRIQARMALAPILAEGFQTKQVKPKHLFHAVDGLVRDLGLGQGDDFWVDPDAPPEVDPATGQPVQEPEQPDPEAMKAQADQQREAAKLQLEREKAEATLTLKQQADAANIDAMREKHGLEMDQKREQAALEANLAREKAQAEYELEVYRIDREAELGRYRADNEAKLSQNRPGGALDA